jgi:hypothetical protein
VFRRHVLIVVLANKKGCLYSYILISDSESGHASVFVIVNVSKAETPTISHHITFWKAVPREPGRNFAS